ncbi:MAG: hypothetical protein IJ048_02955, partial [Clostridia bacterium]|nr:hypothetical protein [Clostridia bacterium]
AALALIMLMAMYAPGSLGLPPLVAGSRLCSTIHLFAVMMYGCAFDALGLMLERRVPGRVLRPLGCAACALVYVFMRCAGMFHGYLYYELTRYPAAVELTRRIVCAMPREMYTLVSTTDEVYQVAEGGYHEELLDFLERASDENYTIPTPYIFLFVEKEPLRYAQCHFAAGPAWLACEKYAPLYGEVGSQHPGVLAGTISEAAAREPLRYGPKRSDSASDFGARVVLESKAYRWYEAFRALYPNECSVMYEDEALLCACIVQNKDCLFSLGILPPA